MLVAFAVDAMFRPCGAVLSPPVWLVSHISACLDLKLPVNWVHALIVITSTCFSILTLNSHCSTRAICVCEKVISGTI